MINIQIDHAAFGDIARISRRSETGMVETRTVQLSSLLDFIKEEKQEKRPTAKRQRVGTFPAGTYSIVQGEDGYCIVVFQPEAKRPMRYGLRGESPAFAGLMWYPSLVFSVDVNTDRRQVTAMKCFAVKESTFEDLSDQTLLFDYPFGNVAARSGNVCLGGNLIEEVSEYKESVEAALQVFFSSCTNDDYYSSKGWDIPQLALITKCAKGQSFPDSVKSSLKPSGYHLGWLLN